MMSLCRKAVNFLKEKWEPLNRMLKFGIIMLSIAGMILVCDGIYEYGFRTLLIGYLVVLYYFC